MDFVENQSRDFKGREVSYAGGARGGDLRNGYNRFVDSCFTGCPVWAVLKEQKRRGI